jgi:hypothetical protein
LRGQSTRHNGIGLILGIQSTGLVGPAPPPDRIERFQDFVAQPVVASFIAGGVAGAVSRTVVSPLERLKILFQIQNVGRNEYKMSVPKALAKMWRDEGWRGFMAGNGTNCIRIVPYSAVQFSAYNVYKRVSNIVFFVCFLHVLPTLHLQAPSISALCDQTMLVESRDIRLYLKEHRGVASIVGR